MSLWWSSQDSIADFNPQGGFSGIRTTHYGDSAEVCVLQLADGLILLALVCAVVLSSSQDRKVNKQTSGFEAKNFKPQNMVLPSLPVVARWRSGGINGDGKMFLFFSMKTGLLSTPVPAAVSHPLFLCRHRKGIVVYMMRCIWGDGDENEGQG